jgi:DNA mismatch repair ATPase MutS
MRVRSCINPSDSLEEGKSLYQMEAETVVSILAQAAEGGVTLCLFDELFRGTNSIDRMAASAAVYSSLVNGGQPRGQPSRLLSRCLVVAATHDLELVRFVGPGFAAFHFGDRVAPGGLEFDYLLRPGVAPSRNAIALLQLLGAPQGVVDDAQARADRIAAAVDSGQAG